MPLIPARLEVLSAVFIRSEKIMFTFIGDVPFVQFLEETERFLSPSPPVVAVLPMHLSGPVLTQAALPESRAAFVG